MMNEEIRDRNKNTEFWFFASLKNKKFKKEERNGY